MSAAEKLRKHPLTEQQKSCIYAILEYQEKHGYPPTVRELCRIMRISSPNGIICHLEALKKKGCLTWDKHRARSIELYADAICEPVAEWPPAKPLAD